MTPSALILAAALGQADSIAQLKQQVVIITNRERRKAGLGPVSVSAELAAAAQAHADDMAARGYFDHDSPEGTKFWQRTKTAGYTGEPRGENIAMGARTAASIMSMWMKSQGHRENILNREANEIGIGFTRTRSLAVMVLGRGSNPGPPPGESAQDGAEPQIELVFPMLGATRWSDTYLAPRPGGRLHMGQDLPAEKMRPLLACFDGEWTGGGILGPNGVSAVYIHLNNDRPGTDDGQAAPLDTFAPGVWPGVKVWAGQMVAYNGDSGNAEDVGPHLHFELILPGVGNINPAAALRAARRASEPVHVPENPELVPLEGQMRWDAEVREVDEARGVLVVDVAGTVDPAGAAKGVSRQTRRYIRLGGMDVRPGVGDFLAVLGPEPGPGKAIEAAGIKVMRTRP